MDQARAVRYRRLALQEPDQHKASLLRLIADEADRGVLVTSDWCALTRPRPKQERPPGKPEHSSQPSGPSEATAHPESTLDGIESPWSAWRPPV
jgi:hypothetical protein